MARRPIKEKLYGALLESDREFLGHDPIKSDEIYALVKNHFPDLCDDDYICPHYGNQRTYQPEWQHEVRNALNRLKVKGLAQGTGIHGEWIFLPRV